MGCGCNGGNPGLKRSYPVPAIVFGEKGITAVEYVGTGLAKAIEGGFTGMKYPFDARPKMFVDDRDLVFLLGEDFKEI